MGRRFKQIATKILVATDVGELAVFSHGRRFSGVIPSMAV